MRKLFTVLSDSFVIASRNFTLVYIFLFSLFLLESLTSLGGRPEFTLKWGIFALIIVMLYAAIMAGWFNMVGQACAQFLDRPKSEALSQNYVKDSFKRLGDFLPGIGQFFAPVLVAYGVYIAYFGLFAWLTRDLWEKNLPILFKLAGATFEQSIQIQLGLTIEQKNALLVLVMALFCGMAIYAVFFMLLMLWPPFVVYYRKGGIEACFASIRQFFQDPLRLIGLALINLAIRMPLILAGPILSGSNPFLAVLFLFLNLLAEVFFNVMLFVYAYELIGKPLPVPIESDSSETAQNPPQ